MKKFSALLWLALVLIPLSATAAEALRVVAGTSLISDIVADLTEGKSETLTLIQGSSCPGHENASTGDYVFAAKAKLLLVHPFQRHLQQVDAMLQAVGNPLLAIVEVSPRGSWLIPDIQKQAVREIAAALEGAAPELAPVVRRRMLQRLQKIDAIAAECRSALAATQGLPVIAAYMQAEFVKWAGFDVIRSFGRAEDVNARGLAEILSAVKDSPVAGVVDNYQSGPDAGLPLALELGVTHVVLSNFPGSSNDAPDYFSLLRRNVAQLQTIKAKP
ncbi:zinc ABC transporter substrate-binding protein [Desulfovibrio desulfuricans]|uniref:metal ABC transporter substrate-binding protein n=1 Tax=Desulfovibrio TaxID=872 RepID=UPI001F33DEBD|nr:zinc ABC transporter substrate-binding protein [Desulfovibrio desulfuricans]UIA99481.1 zinc ABC transporter substrate-binding protein [Desulfovibrio desulfuricans]